MRALSWHHWSHLTGMGGLGGTTEAQVMAAIAAQLATNNAPALQSEVDAYTRLAAKSTDSATKASATRMANAASSALAQVKAAQTAQTVAAATQAATGVIPGATPASGGLSLTSPLTLVQSPVGLAVLGGVALVGVGLFLMLRKRGATPALAPVRASRVARRKGKGGRRRHR